MAGSSATATPPRRPHDLPTVPATRLSASSSVASSHSAQHLSLDAMLSAHAEAENPAMTALEQCISERNLLLSQNTQLWKLVEKSRGLYNDSQKNLERVRTERDAYKAMLLQLGENPDVIARNHRVKEKQLKPSASSNGMRQAPESSTPARPTRHTSADIGIPLSFLCTRPNVR
jgi:RalA-binding protein 1